MTKRMIKIKTTLSDCFDTLSLRDGLVLLVLLLFLLFVFLILLLVLLFFSFFFFFFFSSFSSSSSSSSSRFLLFCCHIAHLCAFLETSTQCNAKLTQSDSNHKFPTDIPQGKASQSHAPMARRSRVTSA